ncbi:MAG: type II secretion system protein [Clostridia bacterium]|nr:type II secretion system protein [Clostridia bacterium]
MMRKISKHSGLTLIELIFVLAIFAVILAVIFNIYVTGFKTFKKDTQRSQVQQDAHLAGQVIEKELRNARMISHTVPGDEETYYCIKLQDDTKNKWLVIQTVYKGKTSTKKVTGDTIESIEFLPGSTGNLIGFIINARIDDNEFDIHSEILLNNIIHLSLPEQGTTVLYYTKY